MSLSFLLPWSVEPVNARPRSVLSSFRAILRGDPGRTKKGLYGLGVNLVLGKSLGSGGYGNIYQATLREHGQTIQVAVKLMPKFDEAMHEAFYSLLESSYPHCSPFVSCVYGLFQVENTQLYGIVYEKMDGDLIKLINSKKGTKDPFKMVLSTLYIGLQMLYAIHKLHESGVYHQDIKLDNFLYKKEKDGRLRIKITDMGISCGNPGIIFGDEKPPMMKGSDILECTGHTTLEYAMPGYYDNEQLGDPRSYSLVIRNETYALALAIRAVAYGLDVSPPYGSHNFDVALGLLRNFKSPMFDPKTYKNATAEERDAIKAADRSITSGVNMAQNTQVTEMMERVNAALNLISERVGQAFIVKF